MNTKKVLVFLVFVIMVIPGCTRRGGAKVDAVPAAMSTETLEALGIPVETATMVPGTETPVPTETMVPTTTPEPTFAPTSAPPTLEPLKSVKEALKDAEKHSILQAKERLDLFMPAEWICEVRVTGGPWDEKPSQEEITRLAKEAGEKEETASNPVNLEDQEVEGFWLMLQFLSGCPDFLPYVQDFVGENIIGYSTNTYYVYLDSSGKKVVVPFADVPKSMYWNKLLLYWCLGEGADTPAYFAETAQ